MPRSRGTRKCSRACCQVSLEKIVRLDPRPHEPAKQSLQRLGILVDAAQEHRLVQHGHPRPDQPAHRKPKLVRQLARVVRVDDGPHGARAAKHSGEVIGDPARAGQPASACKCEGCTAGSTRKRRSTTRPRSLSDSIRGSPPDRRTSRTAGVRARYSQAAFQLPVGDLASAVAREVPAEAMAAVRGAPVAHQEESPVGVVMDEPFRHELAGIPDGSADS